MTTSNKIVSVKALKDYIKCPHYYDYMASQDRYKMKEKTGVKIKIPSFALSFIIFFLGFAGLISRILKALA